MKLVINTQIKENYGAHDWDGEGTCPQYWKFKGGNTYVVRGINAAQAMKLGKTGIPTLTKLITEENEYYEEYILDWSLLDDCEPDGCEPWETPIEFTWGGDRWLAGRTIRNDDEYGYMRREILARREEWIPLEGGERAHFKCEYQTANGWFPEKEAMAQLEAA